MSHENPFANANPNTAPASPVEAATATKLGIGAEDARFITQALGGPAEVFADGDLHFGPTMSEGPDGSQALESLGPIARMTDGSRNPQLEVGFKGVQTRQFVAGLRGSETTPDRAITLGDVAGQLGEGVYRLTPQEALRATVFALGGEFATNIDDIQPSVDVRKSQSTGGDPSVTVDRMRLQAPTGNRFDLVAVVAHDPNGQITDFMVHRTPVEQQQMTA